MEIKENEVYTHEETQSLLKLSSTTVTRMIKKGLIPSVKVGKQYRILGKELLRMLSPETVTLKAHSDKAAARSGKSK